MCWHPALLLETRHGDAADNDSSVSYDHDSCSSFSGSSGPTKHDDPHLSSGDQHAMQDSVQIEWRCSCDDYDPFCEDCTHHRFPQSTPREALDAMLLAPASGTTIRSHAIQPKICELCRKPMLAVDTLVSQEPIEEDVRMTSA